MMVLASCHSLMSVAGDLVGDPLEKASFSATEWLLKTFQGSTTFTGTLNRTAITIQHIQKHHFSSELKRMSVLAKVTHNREDAHYVLAKGAPEVMQRLMKDCPPNFEQRHRQYAAQGSRMIALAAKKLDKGMTLTEMKNMSREQVFLSLPVAPNIVLFMPSTPSEALSCRLDDAQKVVHMGPTCREAAKAVPAHTS
jgi:manganese-transporting P-type ATPase